MAKEFFTKDQVKFEEHPTRKNFLNLTGKTIGKLTVIGFAGYTHKYQFWWCKCSCDDYRYFKVNASSLKKNITKSCGCNYKKNGKRGVYEKDTTVNASKTLSNHLTFKRFHGWNYECEISCSLCNTVTNFPKANNARGFQCCKSSSFETINENLSKFKYTYLGNGTAQCILCGLERPQNSVKDFCGCKDIPDGEDPCAVYFLREENNPWIKIGKGILPEDRRYNINRTASKVGYSFPDVSKQLWVSGEKTAYRLESMLHQYFKDKKVSLPKFDGYDEVFKVTLEDCENYLTSISDVVDQFKLEGYLPEFKIAQHTIDQSIEWCGCWYRSKTHLREVEGYSISEFELVEKYTDRVSANSRISWRRSASKFDKEREAEKKHGKDWGDGIFGTIHGLARRYGQCDGAIWHRVNVLGYSMKYALSLPKDNNTLYWNINNKWYNKKELCKSLGMQKHCVTLRMQRGIPFMYAIIPDRWKLTNVKDRIYVLNGEAYWFADLKHLFGFKESISQMYLKNFTGLRHYLEYWCFISEEDTFEEILF